MKKINLSIMIIYIIVLLYMLLQTQFMILDLIKFLIMLLIGLVAIGINIFFFEKKKLEIHKKFMMVGLFFGIILIFAIPILKGIDESAHFFKVYSVLNKTEAVYDENNKLIDKVPKAIRKATSVYDYLSISNIMGEKIDENEYVLTDQYVGAKLYSGISYIPYLLPMFICYNLLNLDIIWIIYIGRICAFIFWLLISAHTIKIIPKRKEFMSFLCLMPIVLTLVTTYTGDLVTNSVILLFLAYWYKLYDEKRLITKKEIVIITILGMISACAKLVYALIFLIIFLLPIDNFKDKKHKLKCLSSIILIIVLTTIINFSVVGTDLIKSYPAINLQKEFILSNFGKYIFILIKTIFNNFFMYLYQFSTGQTTMCHNSILVSDTISLIYILILALSIILEKSDINLTRCGKVLIGIIIIAIIIIIFTSLYLQWTATHFGVGSGMVYGVQGRYFIPIGALFMLVNTKKDYKFNTNYLWSGVLLINFIIICKIIMIF